MNILKSRKINEALANKVIPHASYIFAYEECLKILRNSEYALPPSGFFIHGPTGAGKSTLIDNILEYSKENNANLSVLSTYLTGSLNFSQIISSILRDLGDPNSNNGTGQNKIKRLTDGLNHNNVKLVIINEFQHLIPENGSIKEMLNEASNAFKSIIDNTKSSLLIVGTDEIIKLWNHDSQIRRRMQSPIRINYLRYPDDRPEWRGIIRAFEKLLKKFDVVIKCPKFDDRMYVATKGCVGAAFNILSMAIAIASQNDSDILSTDILTNSVNKTVDPLDGYLNAFTCSEITLQRLANEITDRPQIAKRAPGMSEVLAQS